MIELQPLHRDHYDDLHKIAIEVEPFDKNMNLTTFMSVMMQREGWAMVEDGKIVGCISFSDFIPGLRVIVHVFADKEHQGHWATRRILDAIAHKVYIEWGLPKMEGFSIDGLSDKAGAFLKQIGFRQEGHHRPGAIVNGELRDARTYGMKREECKWLRESS